MVFYLYHLRGGIKRSNNTYWQPIKDGNINQQDKARGYCRVYKLLKKAPEDLYLHNTGNQPFMVYFVFNSAAHDTDLCSDF